MKYLLDKDDQGAWGILREDGKLIIPHVHLNRLDPVSKLIEHLLLMYQTRDCPNYLNEPEYTLEEIVQIEKDLYKQANPQYFI